MLDGSPRHPPRSRVSHRSPLLARPERSQGAAARTHERLVRQERVQGRRCDAPQPRVAGEEVRRGLGVPALAEEVRRPRGDADPAHHLEPGRGRLPHALGRLHHRPRHGGADAHGLCLGRAEAALAAADGARRRDLVPALQRAGRGLGPRRHPHAFGARRRRLGHQRPEDLDLGRTALEVRDPGDAQRLRFSQAQGSHLLLDRHGVARGRGAADQAGVG